MSQVKERPILFSAPMVRAILEGRKTVTRRVCKPQPSAKAHTTCASGNPMGAWWETGKDINRCPHGKPGDRLWVRETHSFVPDPEEPAGYSQVLYAADGQQYGKNRPSIHMFRADSRILLEITDVRVERLQDISRADIRAEGLQCPPELASDDVSPNYRDWYPAAWRELWESTGGDWNATPWVWVVEFKRLTP